MSQWEQAVDQLSPAEYPDHAVRVERAVREIIATLAGHPVSDVPEAGAKSGDVDDERPRRNEALRRVRAGRVAQNLLAEAVTRCAVEDAADAVWLGASLADLGEAVGSTRQAARKRWPDLGRVHRVRRWVAGHADDLVTVLRMVLDEAPGYAAPQGSADLLDRTVRALDRSLWAAVADRHSGSVCDPDTGRPVRWRRLAEVVDGELRTLVDLAVPTTARSDTALAAGRGVLAHYDAVVAEPAAASA
ncbi:hypothetical protein [Plantactinospora sp. B24E8]|uniref:hypothetical protein n=1 Tax=Plantactinospora sp. B24E8 TaxID=3153567 RepID=UPI00325F3044